MLLITFQQVLKLFIFLLIGFLLRRYSVLPVTASGVLSLLEVNLFVPCLNFLTFSQNFTLEKLSGDLPLLAASLISCLVTIAAGTFAGRHLSKDHYAQNLAVYSINMPNTGYVGAPLILAMFGSETLMRMQLFCLPMSIYTYTVGYQLLMDRKGFSPRSLLSPALLAIFFGAVIGMCRIPLPSVLTDVLTSCSSCLGPIAMLLTGCLIAQFHFRDILCDPLIYKVVALRMIVVPLAVLSACRAIGLSRDVLLILAAVYTMPTGLNTVIFPASVGKDCHLGAGMACVSNTLGILTIPLFFALFL